MMRIFGVRYQKISSFNVENLFRRARALNLQDEAKTRAILDQHAKLNALLQKPKYTAAVKADIMDLIKKLGLTKDDTAEFVILRQNRGRLLTRKKNGTIEIVAEGRESWVGWVELRNGPVDDQAILNTGQVIRDVNADIQAVVEVESRPALLEFSDQVLKTVGGNPFEHAMLIDGNDDRGIDVGVLTRGDFDIGIMRSHVDDEKNGERIFSRDCPEFKIRTPNGATLWLLVNHFKSKGFDTQATSNKRRKAQATRVAEIYNDLLNAGETNVVIVGDLNDTPNSDPLSRFWLARISRTSRRIRTSMMAAFPAPSFPGLPRTRSITSCSHPLSSRTSPTAESFARAPGLAKAEEMGHVPGDRKARACRL